MIDTTYFVRCILALDKAYLCLQSYPEEALEFDIYRSAVIKEFEVVLEQSGKLLKKVLADYLHSNKG